MTETPQSTPRPRTEDEIKKGIIPAEDYKPKVNLSAEELANASYDELAELYGITPEEARNRVNFGDYMNLLVDTIAPAVAADPGEYTTLKRGLVAAMANDGITEATRPDEYKIIMNALTQIAKGATKPMVPDEGFKPGVSAKRAEVQAKKTQDVPAINNLN